MLPVALFIAFWVLLALAVFFIAGSGGPGGARRAAEARSYRGSRAVWLTEAGAPIRRKTGFKQVDTGMLAALAARIGIGALP